jgi:pimeloyl-ACP methyl ester carboxylesterase
MDRMIQTSLGALHAVIVGSGPSVLLMHGSHPSNSWSVWEHNVQELAEAGYRVYALDLLGYGQSGGQMVDHKMQAKALLELMDAEGISAATLGGVSWGGMIALEVALTAPERVHSLILVDSAGVGIYAEDQIGSLGCPTLVVWGEDDTVIPLANAAWFGATIPNCRVHVIADVTQQPGVPPWGGHHPMRFRPAEFNAAAISFLKGIQTPTLDRFQK